MFAGSQLLAKAQRVWLCLLVAMLLGCGADSDDSDSQIERRAH